MTIRNLQDPEEAGSAMLAAEREAMEGYEPDEKLLVGTVHRQYVCVHDSGSDVGGTD